jgi:hypothetical protein
MSEAIGYDEGKAVLKLKPVHEQAIDLLLLNPRIKIKEIAETLGYSEQWMGRIMKSDAFSAAYAARRDKAVLPTVQKELNKRLHLLTESSVSTLQRTLDETDSASIALKSLGLVHRIQQGKE